VKPFKLFCLFLFTTVLLFSDVNTLKKALVEKGELNLYFSKSFSKHSVKHFTLQNPHREIYDLEGIRLAHKRVPLGLGSHVRMAQNSPNTVRIVIDKTNGYKPLSYQPMLASREYCISLPRSGSSKSDLPAKRYQKPKINIEVTSKPKKYKKTSKVSRVKKIPMRSHKHELIVIDAGHGGHDTGAIGGGKREKDLVLSISRKVAQELKRRGYPVYLTRNKNRFLKLSQRTHIADKKGAVAFISIHANAVAKKYRNKVHGVETYFLQNTRDSKSQRIAARENAAVLKGAKSKLSKRVIIDSVLNGPKIVQSNKLAIDVQRRIITNLRAKYSRVKDGGVRHAPFYVLVGASRPSILVEVGYISNPKERKRLFTSRYQNLIAKGIAEGVSNYLNNRKKEIDF
jgi:N-acetylmuramoyl-L-alanine amidase